MSTPTRTFRLRSASTLLSQTPPAISTAEGSTYSHVSKHKKIHFFLRFINTILLLICIISILSSFLAHPMIVSGNSMSPMFSDGDSILMNILYFDVHIGDVVVAQPYKDSDKLIIKRIVAVAGQTVDYDKENDVLLIDGKPENKVTALPGDIHYPVKVPENCVFLLGDKRSISHDSRFSDVGFIPTDQIIGEVFFNISDHFDLSAIPDSKDISYFFSDLADKLTDIFV